MSKFKLWSFSLFFIVKIIFAFDYSDYYYPDNDYGYYHVNYGYDYYTNNNVKEKDFYCDHKVGRNNKTFKNYNVTICPSRQCMVFYDFCDNFWATSCYDPKSPMHLAKKYNGVRNRLRKRNSSTSKFYLCEFENCTANLLKELNTDFFESFIYPEPISFDFKLWPKLGKEQRTQKGKLKNGISLDREIANNKYSEFYGYALPNATKLWMEFQFLNKTGKFNYVKFSFNFPNSTLTYKINGKMAKIVSWKGIDKKTRYLEISFKNSDFYEFYVDNVKINFTYSKNVTGNLHTVYFGGDWKNDVYGKKFRQAVLQYPSIPIKNISCPENMKLANPEMNITNIQKYFYVNNSNPKTANQNPNSTFYISMFENYETKSYELRSSLCPGADIIRFDISIVKHAKDFYAHSTVWFRRNLRWTNYFNFPLPKPNCTEIKVVAGNSDIILYCGSDKAPVPNILGKNIKYLIEEKKKKFVCGK